MQLYKTTFAQCVRLFLIFFETVNYLLEKVRLVQQGPTERNFHTFYQFLSDSNIAIALRRDIQFTTTIDPTQYDCLYKGGCVEVSSMNENEEFEDTYNAFLTLGKYSKRRRSNVAVIIDRKVFISSFLFYCLLFNHSFQTNSNRMTNCCKTYSLLYLQLYKTTFAQCVRLF